jgi:hypothetical protein
MLLPPFHSDTCAEGVEVFLCEQLLDDCAVWVLEGRDERGR